MPEIKSKIQNPKSKIIENRKIKNNYFKIIILCPQIAKSALPGQFVNIRITDSYSPFLRRPFSIHRVKGKNIEILYKVVGEGTEILSQRGAGEYLDIIGPLGNGFDLIPKTDSLTPILVAGGIGVAPLLFLAEKLIQGLKFKVKIRPLVLLGAKTKEDILCEKDFKKLECKIEISTDDGSAGFKGKITDLLRHILSTLNYKLFSIYACGPKPMLKEITIISKKFNIPAYVSLEEHMACGIGICLGCAVSTKTGFKRVCKDGPVFKAEEIIW